MSKKKSNGYGKGTFVESNIFLSPAWISLGQKRTSKTVSSCSPQVLMLFLGKRQFKKVKVNGQKSKQTRTDDNRFTLTYKELEARGIAQPRATRAIDELLAKGFIKVIDPGGAYEKHKAVYALDDAYILWRKGQEPIYVRNNDIHRGYQDPKRRGPGKTISTHVNEGYPHAHQQGTPPQKTRTLTGDTHILSEMEV